MKASLLLKRRVVIAEDAFVELLVWQLPQPLSPSAHDLKYRLAYVVEGECVVLYDNERGKGDHRHFGSEERPYKFASPDRLLVDFQSDIARWNSENGRT